jgi:2-methylcitrate dehydratase PrpD
MTTISEKIAEWVHTTNYSSFSQELVYLAKRSILDFIGVTLAGTKEPAGQIIKQYIYGNKGKEESTAIGLGTKTSSVDAALANGIVGHCLDYDDIIHPMPGAGGPHITAVILPAALAIAEKENKTGEELIEAYVIGCEVVYRLGRAMEPDHYTKGWHNTGTQGIFGATAAASKLLKLTPDQMTYAFGIAASDASGLRENFGTMTKSFHAGKANSKALQAAMLAKLGFTSSKTAFEGKYGFLNVYCKNPRIEELTLNLGKPFCLTEIKLKLYPCCGGVQCAIDATLELVKSNDIKAEDVDEVIVKCVPLAYSVLVYNMPKTSLQGKFSMQFPLALALTDRQVTLNEFTDEKVNQPEIIDLMKKIKVVCVPELADENLKGEPVIIEIQLKNGRQFINRVDFHKGTSQNPLSVDELMGKFRSCAKIVLSEKDIEKSINLVMKLEKLNDISELLNIIRG